MRNVEPVIEESRVVEDVHHLRLMALLHELAREKGNRGAAAALGLDPRTVASCLKTGRLTWRVREALERGLQSGAGSAAAQQRERNDALKGPVEELEGKLRSGLDEVRAAVAGEAKAVLDDQAKSLRRLERRLVRLEAGTVAQDGMERASSGGPEPEQPKRRYVPPSPYPQLVTPEAEPDEDLVYGDATPVIVEWRGVRAEFLKTLKTGTTLDRTEVQEPMLELELSIVEKHRLTLPPARFPWDEFDRRDKVWELTQGPQAGPGGAGAGAAEALAAPGSYLRAVEELTRCATSVRMSSYVPHNIHSRYHVLYTTTRSSNQSAVLSRS